MNILRFVKASYKKTNINKSFSYTFPLFYFPSTVFFLPWCFAFLFSVVQCSDQLGEIRLDPTAQEARLLQLRSMPQIQHIARLSTYSQLGTCTQITRKHRIHTDIPGQPHQSAQSETQSTHMNRDSTKSLISLPSLAAHSTLVRIQIHTGTRRIPPAVGLSDSVCPAAAPGSQSPLLLEQTPYSYPHTTATHTRTHPQSWPWIHLLESLQALPPRHMGPPTCGLTPVAGTQTLI